MHARQRLQWGMGMQQACNALHALSCVCPPPCYMCCSGQLERVTGHGWQPLK